MATKNLARTAIEGGRYYHNCWERRHSNGAARARLRSYLEQVRMDPALFDAISSPQRDHVGRMFRDKLGPPMRWLASHVGQPWDRVYAELVAKLDTRTLPGRHIVFDHMLKWVAPATARDRWSSSAPFVVDAQGLLRTNARGARQRSRWEPRDLTLGMQRWLDNRKVREHGDLVFWCEPTGWQWLSCLYPRWCALAHQPHRTRSNGVVVHQLGGPHFRQSRRLTASELGVWRSFSEGQRELVRYEPRR